VDSLATVWVWISTIAFAIVLAASAGLRAWLPLLITSALARLGAVDLGEGFAFLATTPALVLFSVATVVEIAGDKIPAVDHALDVASTFLRPASGALLAAAVMWKADDPLIATVLGIVIGAPIALAPHAAKAATRSLSSATTGGFGNPVLSVAEDIAAFSMTILAVLAPVLALLVLVAGTAYAIRAYRQRRARRATP
jgi:hypothetical protein